MIQTDVYNPLTVAKCFTMAEHPATPPNEAMNAFQLGIKHLRKHGRTMESLVLNMDTKSFHTLKGTPSHKFLLAIDALESKHAAIFDEVKALRKENSTLKARIAPADGAEPITANDGFYGFLEFRQAVVAILKKDHGWQAFYEHMTGEPHANLQKWRQADKVPAAAFDVIMTFDLGKYHVEKPTGSPWTNLNYNRLEALCKEGKKDKEIVEILSREFSRPLTLNSIAGAKSRLREQGRITK